jgi:hypothetical protein
MSGGWYMLEVTRRAVKLAIYIASWSHTDSRNVLAQDSEWKSQSVGRGVGVARGGEQVVHRIAKMTAVSVQDLWEGILDWV